MEEILMASFGGGTSDWKDIITTKYDWEDIFNHIRKNFDDDFKIEINDLYYTILVLATIDIENKINEILEENNNINKDEKAILLIIAENIFDKFEYFCNCLDTHITFIGEDKEKEVLIKYLKDEIENINEKIGFTYIENLEEEEE